MGVGHLIKLSVKGARFLSSGCRVGLRRVWLREFCVRLFCCKGFPPSRCFSLHPCIARPFLANLGLRLGCSQLNSSRHGFPEALGGNDHTFD